MWRSILRGTLSRMTWADAHVYQRKGDWEKLVLSGFCVSLVCGEVVKGLEQYFDCMWLMEH